MHDKGEGVGACADFPKQSPQGCSRIEIWDHPREHYEAERLALQWRGAIVPYEIVLFPRTMFLTQHQIIALSGHDPATSLQETMQGSNCHSGVT